MARRRRDETSTSSPASACSSHASDSSLDLLLDVHTSCSPGEWRLYSLAEIPDWLRDNPFILSGYRVHLNFRQCLASLVRWHNETGNIWTHLIGMALFVVMAIRAFRSPSLAGESALGQALFALFFAACFFCFACSAVYHTFLCHSRAVNAHCARLDFSGISLLLVASYYPPLYYGLACLPRARAVYMSAVTIVGAAVVLAPNFAFFGAPSFRLGRVALYAAMAAAGVVPSVHAMIAMRPDADSRAIQARIYAMYGLYGAGALVYFARVPERWLPGRFDYGLHSHVLWHTLALAGALFHAAT